MKMRLKLIRSCITIKNEDDEGESGIQETIIEGGTSPQGRVILLDLPMSILGEIFLKLPIKTMLCCRCVCKTFSTVLRDPCFLNAHQMKPILMRVWRLWMQTFSPLYLSELGDGPGESKSTVKPVLANFPQNEGPLYVLGSCNGLVCVAETSPGHRMPRFIYISNPILGEYYKLPVVGKRNLPASYGFGFDPSSGHYKVVRVLPERNPTDYGVQVKTYAEVFTVGVDVKWRTLRHETGPTILGPEGMFVFQEVNRLFGSEGLLFQETVHWTLNRASYLVYPTKFDFICALTIGEEKFRSIRCPAEIRKLTGLSRLLVLRNCLSIINSPLQGPPQLNIWTMKEYGVVESWSKEYSIKDNLFPGCNFCTFLPIPPIPSTEKGDGEIIMFSRGTDLILYNIDKMKFSCIKIGDETNCFASKHVYLPSLVSLSNLLSGTGVKVRTTVKKKRRWFMVLNRLGRMVSTKFL